MGPRWSDEIEKVVLSLLLSTLSHLSEIYSLSVGTPRFLSAAVVAAFRSVRSCSCSCSCDRAQGQYAQVEPVPFQFRLKQGPRGPCRAYSILIPAQLAQVEPVPFQIRPKRALWARNWNGTGSTWTSMGPWAPGPTFPRSVGTRCTSFCQKNVLS